MDIFLCFNEFRFDRPSNTNNKLIPGSILVLPYFPTDHFCMRIGLLRAFSEQKEPVRRSGSYRHKSHCAYFARNLVNMAALWNRAGHYTPCIKKTSHLWLAITLTHVNGF